MITVALDLGEAKERALRDEAERRGLDVETFVRETVEASLPPISPLTGLPMIPGPIHVPEWFDWTKNSSWYRLMDEWESEDEIPAPRG